MTKKTPKKYQLELLLERLVKKIILSIGKKRSKMDNLFITLQTISYLAFTASIVVGLLNR